MERRRMSLEDNPIVVMSEGNPGATTVLVKFVQDDIMGLFDILNLDDMNIRGSQIWLAYKDYCGEDMELLKELVKGRDAGLVEAVNIASVKYDVPFKVVQSGASGYSSPDQFKFTEEEMQKYANMEFKSYEEQHPEFGGGS